MSTHLHIAPNKEGERKLSEPCDFCGAMGGEPCHVRYYICPGKDCEELYKTSGAALRCTHNTNAK